MTSGPDKFASTCCRGCTLTDLCIGLAIAAMLTAGVLPVVGRSRETAERVKCAGNLRQIAQAILLYSMANGGNLPRTLYDSNVSPTVSYTAWQASDPFASDGPGPNDITAALYLLLRTTDSIAETFVCPKTIATTEPWNYQGQSRSAFSNFPSRQYLSYSYTNVYGPVSQKLASLPALFVLAADMNPGPGAMTVTNASASQQMKGGNSANHDGDGQGVLYADGHVEFQQTPFVGVARDNIYTYGNSRTTAGSGINGPSTDGNDSVLLPTALDGPAPGPVGVAGTLRWLLPASAGLLLLMILLMWRTTRRNYAI